MAGFLFVACGALRLARFNVYAPTKSNAYFQGLPIPSAAAMIATTVFFFNFLGHTGPVQNGAVLALVFLLSFLMVSNFRYFSLKDPTILKSERFNTMVLLVLVLSLTAVRPRVVLFLMFLCYVFSGPVLTVYKIRELRRQRHLVPQTADGPAQTGTDPPQRD